MVSCCYLLGVRCFDVEVWSWWGNNIPVNLYKMNVIFSLDKKGHGSNAQLSPSKISGLAKRRQISVGSSFRTKFPHSAQLTPLREPGTQPSWPSISSGCPSGRPGLTDCGQGTWPLLFSRRDRDGGEVHRSSRLVEGLSEGPGALQDVASSLFPGASSIDPSLGELKGLEEEARICLLPPSLPDDHHTAGCWPIAPLNVPHWQLLVGKAHYVTDQ